MVGSRGRGRWEEIVADRASAPRPDPGCAGSFARGAREWEGWTCWTCDGCSGLTQCPLVSRRRQDKRRLLE